MFDATEDKFFYSRQIKTHTHVTTIFKNICIACEQNLYHVTGLFFNDNYTSCHSYYVDSETVVTA